MKPTVHNALIRPDGSGALAQIDPSSTPKAARRQAERDLEQKGRRLTRLQERLFAEGKRSLLLVLQGMDTSGKDGTVKHVISLANPQGVRHVSFKAPTPAEARRGFLWRIRQAVPEPGQIGIFNRSHYEDAVWPVVHGELAGAAIEKRYREINEFERELVRSGTHLVKVFLHISYEEQRYRLAERLRRPEKRWKFSSTDLPERSRWLEYQAAYDAALEACSTKTAPWFIVPANRKWYRDWAVWRLLTETLTAMDPKFPHARVDIRDSLRRLRTG